MGRKWRPPGGLTSMSIPQNCSCQCLCPCSEPQPPPASARDPPILAGRSGPVSYEVIAFYPGPGAHRTCVHLPKVEFLFAPVLWNFCDQTALAFKAGFSGGSSPLPDPQAGKSDMGLRTFTPVGELLWYNYFPVCGSTTQHVWDLILS